jgi:hypothetical protein
MFLKTSSGDKNITTATQNWTRECYGSQENYVDPTPSASNGSAPSVPSSNGIAPSAPSSNASSNVLSNFKKNNEKCEECGECDCNCKRMKRWIWLLGGFIVLLVIVILYLLFSDDDSPRSSSKSSSSSSSSWFSSSSSPKSGSKLKKSKSS